MRAGKLRHRVTIERLVPLSPAFTNEGEPSNAWVEYVTVWASVEPLQGNELFRAQQEQSEVTGKIRMRYRPGITTTMRAVFEDRIYNIHNIIDPEERHLELELRTSQGLNLG